MRQHLNLNDVVYDPKRRVHALVVQNKWDLSKGMYMATFAVVHTMDDLRYVSRAETFRAWDGEVTKDVRASATYLILTDVFRLLNRASDRQSCVTLDDVRDFCHGDERRLRVLIAFTLWSDDTLEIISLESIRQSQNHDPLKTVFDGFEFTSMITPRMRERIHGFEAQVDVDLLSMWVDHLRYKDEALTDEECVDQYMYVMTYRDTSSSASSS